VLSKTYSFPIGEDRESSNATQFDVPDLLLHPLLNSKVIFVDASLVKNLGVGVGIVHVDCDGRFQRVSTKKLSLMKSLVYKFLKTWFFYGLFRC
jgi:hypothetical protein